MKIIKQLLKHIPIVRDYLDFLYIYYECSSIIKFLIARYCPVLIKKTYWPIHSRSEVRENVIIGKGARVGHRPNCIIQGRGALFVGDYVEIGPNCVIISGNHDIYNQKNLIRKETIIGDNCWLASSSIVLAGVVLGPRTIVGAGSIVTKSFPEGYCVIAGNPARIVKKIDKEAFKCERPIKEYYGYISESNFPSYFEKKFESFKFKYDLSQVTANEFLIRKLSSNS